MESDLNEKANLFCVNPYFLLLRQQYMNLKAETDVKRIKHYAYRTQNMIGKGAAGKVYQGVNQKSGEKVAIKIMQMSKIDNQVTEYLLACQKQALHTISNPYVLSAYDIIQTQDQCLIITPLCDGGTLKQHITAKGKLGETEALHILVKLLRGYAAIKNKGFLHRDIKSSNVMFRKGEPVIIDFGYCEQISRKKPQMFYNVGSPSYMSPEAYFKSMYSEKSDLWSLGMILYEMIEGFTIDHGQPIDRYFSSLLKHGFALRQKISHPVKALLKSVLNPNFHERPSAEQLIQGIENIIFQGNNNQQFFVPTYRQTNFPTPNAQPQNIPETGQNNKISLKKEKDRQNQRLQQMLVQSRQRYELTKVYANNLKEISNKNNQQPPHISWKQQHENQVTISPQPNSMPNIKYVSMNTHTHTHQPPAYLQPKLDIKPQNIYLAPNQPLNYQSQVQTQDFRNQVNLQMMNHEQPRVSVQNNMISINPSKPMVCRSMLPAQQSGIQQRNQRLIENARGKVFHSQIINTQSIITMEQKPNFCFNFPTNQIKPENLQDRDKYAHSYNQPLLKIQSNNNSVVQSVIIQPQPNILANKSKNPVFKSLIIDPNSPQYPPMNVKFINSQPQIIPPQSYTSQQYAQHNPRSVPIANNNMQQKNRLLTQSMNEPFSPIAHERNSKPFFDGRRQENRVAENADRNFIRKVAPYFHMNTKKTEQDPQTIQLRQTMPNWAKPPNTMGYNQGSTHYQIYSRPRN